LIKSSKEPTLINQPSWEKQIVDPQSEAILGQWVDMPAYFFAQQGSSAELVESLINQFEAVSTDTPLFVVFPKALLGAQQNEVASWELCCSVATSLKNAGYSLNLVIPHVRLMSEAASAIDALAAHQLPRGIAGLKVLMSVGCAASALSINKLVSYFDGAVVDAEQLGLSAFATAELDSPMTSSSVLERLIFDSLQCASDAQKPCYLGPQAMVTSSLIERVEDKKVTLTGVIKPLV
jgi:hypothetical protein